MSCEFRACRSKGGARADMSYLYACLLAALCACMHARMHACIRVRPSCLSSLGGVLSEFSPESSSACAEDHDHSVARPPPTRVRPEPPTDARAPWWELGFRPSAAGAPCARARQASPDASAGAEAGAPEAAEGSSGQGDGPPLSAQARRERLGSLSRAASTGCAHTCAADGAGHRCGTATPRAHVDGAA